MTAGYQNCGKVAFTSTPTQNNGTNTPAGIGGGGGDTGGGTTPQPCVQSSSNTPIVTTLPAGVTQAMVAATCPAVGQDSECGVVIIVADSGVSLYFTGQGPYDGHDDTLVGVINNSSNPVTSLTVSSNLDIMGFDGDGLDTYDISGTKTKVGGNSMDTSLYGGPNAYYTNITPDNTGGNVYFISPVPAGKTTFFGLENALSSTTACLNTSAH